MSTTERRELGSEELGPPTWEDMLADLRVNAGGTASELAARYERKPDDKGFRWALQEAMDENILQPEGEGRSRTYVRLQPLRIARMCPRCQARAFGDPSWYCPDHATAEDQPNRPYHDPRMPKHRRVCGAPRPTIEQFRRFSANAAKRPHPIGSGKT